MINETYILYFLLAANLLILLLAVTALQSINARCRRLEEFKLSVSEKPESEANVADDAGYLAVLKKLDQRFARVEKIVESTTASSAAKPRAMTQSLPIENAVRMAQQGASIEDLTRNCGLNIGEARLMQRLHGRGQMAAVGG